MIYRSIEFYLKQPRFRRTHLYFCDVKTNRKTTTEKRNQEKITDYFEPQPHTPETYNTRISKGLQNCVNGQASDVIVNDEAN